MVAEMANEDHSPIQDQSVALDDQGVTHRHENNPLNVDPVASTTQVTTSTSDDSPQLPPSAPPTTQAGSTQERPTAIGPAEATTSKSALEADDTTDSSYHLKWIPWNSGMIPIVMQSMNGPCPLIATMNVLLLREKIKLPNMLEQITESQLLAYIGESIMDSMPADAQNDENMLLNLEQNIHDAIEILPKLKSGLDVNIRFTGITDFEYTPECIIFDLLRIPLYHGWLSDPGLYELEQVIGNQSYNQLVDNIITNKNSQDPIISTRVLLAEEFLDKTASQLTVHGLNELKGKIKDNEIGILFRNNHFLTLFKREGEIYTLVTDHGYLTEDNIVWESLDSVEGAGRFFDCNFQLSETTNRQVSELKAIDQRQQQMVNDYLVALSLNREETKNAANTSDVSTRQLELDDLEVARKLQAEEDAYYEEMLRKQQQSTEESSSDQPELRGTSGPGSSSDVVLRDSADPVIGVHPDCSDTKASSSQLASERISTAQPVPAHEVFDGGSQASTRPKNYAEVVGQNHPNNLPSNPNNPNGQYQSPEHPPDYNPEVSSTSSVQYQSDNGHNRHGAGRSNRARSERSTKESNCVVH